MRVLHLVHKPRYSGAEMLVSGLTEIHAGMGHTSMVASYTPPERDFATVIERQKGIGVPWVYPNTTKVKFARVAYVAWIARGFRPDVVFAHSEIPAAYARLAGLKPVVSVLHSQTNYQSVLSSLVERTLQFRSAGVISVSEIARKNYEARFTTPVTKYIANGVDLAGLSFSETGRSRVRCQLGLSDSSRMVVQVGRIARVKRQHLSLAAIAALIRTDGDLHLVFAGIAEDAGYLRDLKSEVVRHNLTGNIHFVGGRQDIPDILSASDLFAMPSAIEAQGIALVEALASGVPAIVSRIEGFAFAAGMQGVDFVDPEDISAYQSGMRAALYEHPQRHHRDLSGLDLRRTATEYLEFASACTS